MRLHTQSLPGLKYFCPDFHNQQLLKVTKYDDDMFHSYTSPVFSNMHN